MRTLARVNHVDKQRCNVQLYATCLTHIDPAMKQMVTNGTYTRTHTDWLVVGKGRCHPNGRTRRRFTETGMPRGVDSAEGFEGLRDGLESSGQESTCGINFFGNFSKGG